MERRRLEQIDQCRDAAHEAQRLYQKYKDWGDPEMANLYLDMKTTLHKMAAVLVRREDRHRRALEALVRSKVEDVSV